MFKVYCVEDDESIRELIVYALNNAEFEAEGFQSGDEFFTKVYESSPDIVLLDIMLPGEDGLKILEKLKLDFKLKDIPVIMLTAKTSEFDKVRGLDMGADDYIAKPFGVMELMSRVKAVLRRSKNSSLLNTIEFNNISMDYENRSIRIRGELVNLTYKEFELLYFLLKNRKIVLTRERIIDKVWGFDFEGETRTVDVHIATLRQKLGQEGKLIKTIRNVGYKVENIK